MPSADFAPRALDARKRFWYFLRRIVIILAKEKNGMKKALVLSFIFVYAISFVPISAFAVNFVEAPVLPENYTSWQFRKVFVRDCPALDPAGVFTTEYYARIVPGEKKVEIVGSIMKGNTLLAVFHSNGTRSTEDFFFLYTKGPKGWLLWNGDSLDQMLNEKIDYNTQIAIGALLGLMSPCGLSYDDLLGLINHVFGEAESK